MKLPKWLRTRRRRPAAHAVTVTLTVDTKALNEAFQRANEALQRLGAAASAMRMDLRPLERAPARLADRQYIRDIALRERLIAHAYLDDLINDAYARYGLTREDRP